MRNFIFFYRYNLQFKSTLKFSINFQQFYLEAFKFKKFDPDHSIMKITQ